MIFFIAITKPNKRVERNFSPELIMITYIGLTFLHLEIADLIIQSFDEINMGISVSFIKV